MANDGGNGFERARRVSRTIKLEFVKRRMYGRAKRGPLRACFPMAHGTMSPETRHTGFVSPVLRLHNLLIFQEPVNGAILQIVAGADDLEPASLKRLHQDRLRR